MASSSKRQTTREKMAREQAVRERRARKQQKKDDKKQAATALGMAAASTLSARGASDETAHTVAHAESRHRADSGAPPFTGEVV